MGRCTTTSGSGPAAASGAMRWARTCGRLISIAAIISRRAMIMGGSDVRQFMRAYQRGNQPDSWWRNNVDLPRYYSYRAILEAIHHYDLDAGKNYDYYFNPNTGKWIVIPWDIDLTWADNMYGGGNEPFKRPVLSRPAFNV